MPINIDYSFIGKLEGKCLLQGYVPKPKSSQSGVTVATGFDLGARNEHDLRKLGITGNLLNRLIPYLGLQGPVAANKLKRSPLSISSHECRFLENVVQSHFTNQVRLLYNGAIQPNAVKFENLDSKYQTIIMSVAYQYGAYLSAKTPKFWKAVVAQNWQETVHILRHFQDDFSPRRNLEADYLEGKSK